MSFERLLWRSYTGLGDTVLDLLGTTVLANRLDLDKTSLVCFCDDQCHWGPCDPALFVYPGNVQLSCPLSVNPEGVSFQLKGHPGATLHPYKIMKYLQSKGISCNLSDLWHDYKTAATNLQPAPLLDNHIHPETHQCVGIHLRKSDKIDDNNKFHGTKKHELEIILTRIKRDVQHRAAAGQKHFFVCSEDAKWKRDFEQWLVSAIKDATIIQPLPCSLELKSKAGHAPVLDFFSLSRCKTVLQGIGYSTFSMSASMVGNSPLHNFLPRAREAKFYMLNWWFPLTDINDADTFAPIERYFGEIGGHLIVPPMQLPQATCATEQKDIVLVVARYHEDLAWLKDVPSNFDIIVYNKDVTREANIPHDRAITIIPRDNVGREADTYLTYIIDHYDTLPETIVFCQGDPFPHSPHFIDLLKLSDTWSPYQSLTLQYLPGIPPPAVHKLFGTHDWFYTERISTHTLSSIRFYDAGVAHLCDAYLKDYNLSIGTNIIHHHMSLVGLEDLISPDQDVIEFEYAAQFAVKADQVLKHPTKVYSELRQKMQRKQWFEASIQERCWRLMFDNKNVV